MVEMSDLDIVREALVIADNQPQNIDKSDDEMRALAVALFGKELVEAALNG